jgi:hypothetical protein
MFDTVLGYVNENFSPLTVITSDDDIEFKVVEVRKEPITINGAIDDRWLVLLHKLEYFDDPDIVRKVGGGHKSICRDWQDVLKAVEMFTEGHTNYSHWMGYPESLCNALFQTWEDDDSLYDNSTVFEDRYDDAD